MLKLATITRRPARLRSSPVDDNLGFLINYLERIGRPDLLADWVLVRLYDDVETISNDGQWTKQEGIRLVDGCLDLKALRRHWNLDSCSVIDPVRLTPFHASDPDKLSRLALTVLTDSKYNSEWKGTAPSLSVVPYQISEAPTARRRPRPSPPKYVDYIPLFEQARQRARWRKTQHRRRIFVRIPPVFKPIATCLLWVHDNTDCDARKVFAVWVFVLGLIIFMELWRLLKWFVW